MGGGGRRHSYLKSDIENKESTYLLVCLDLDNCANIVGQIRLMVQVSVCKLC